MIDRKREPSVLTVRLHGRRIGLITRLAGERNIFAFDEDYIEDPARPTLSLSFKAASGGLVTDVRPVNTRVPPFFSNLLPEGHLRDYLAAHANVRPEREFFLLNALGADLPGAVSVVPAVYEGADDRDRHGHDVHHSHRDDGAMRFSLAGVQLKFSAVLSAAGGLTIPVDGIGGSWIVKLPSVRFDAVPENEFVMMELARRIGISVPEIKLVPVQEIAGLPPDVGGMNGQALAVKRFDRRPDGGRVHMEDFAQVFGIFPERKYERRSYASIAAVLWTEIGEVAVSDFMRRLVFTVLTGNADMHLKNWSLIYPDGRTPVLAPAYDLAAILPYLPKGELALGFGGSKDIDRIAQDQVRRFADKAGLALTPLWRIVMETVERTVAAWRGHDAADILPGQIRKSIAGHMEKVAQSTLAVKA